jgi:hypothetical protein
VVLPCEWDRVEEEARDVALAGEDPREEAGTEDVLVDAEGTETRCLRAIALLVPACGADVGAPHADASTTDEALAATMAAAMTDTTGEPGSGGAAAPTSRHRGYWQSSLTAVSLHSPWTSSQCSVAWETQQCANLPSS